jgi:hypothetical protein
VLLYGGMLEWLSTRTRSEFLRFSPTVVFEKVTTADLFFGTKECLRADASSCFPPGHEYYEVGYLTSPILRGSRVSRFPACYSRSVQVLGAYVSRMRWVGLPQCGTVSRHSRHSRMMADLKL